MGWTYTNDPENVPNDEVRLLIGDTDENDPQLLDEEIAYFIAKNPNSYRAAARAALSIASRYARKTRIRVDDTEIDAQERFRHYQELARDLNRQASARTTSAWAGGISKADKTAREDDGDRVEPAFVRDEITRVATLEEDT